jgi:multidrug efflux pump subunit AcrA (membrane-fusion protein)
MTGGDETAGEPTQQRGEGERLSSRTIPSAVVIALIGALSGLLGGGVTAYINYRTERQKSGTEVNIEHGRSQTQLEIEDKHAQIDIQRHQSEVQLKIEQLKAEGALTLEREKQDASAKLSRQEFETKLIMQAVQGVPPEVATNNLQYFLKAGFISDPEGKIAHLSVTAPPSIPNPNAALIPLKDPQACTKLAG